MIGIEFARGQFERVRRRLKSGRRTGANEGLPDGFVNVRDLLTKLTVEELKQSAEDYAARIRDFRYHHAKPFATPSEAAELLSNFTQVIQGLDLVPGMTVLDFGAGTCWASRYINQMGCKVIALDVSPSALKIGKALFENQPVAGEQPPVDFMEFDGHRIPLADESVDNIVCLDAFHHVPNPDEVLREMFRVLRPGGRVGFSEPGPRHSLSPASQYEMRNYRVVERDIDLEEVWISAQGVGFCDLTVAVFSPALFAVSFQEFQSLNKIKDRCFESIRKYQADHRVFFLRKSGHRRLDSRSPGGLAARLIVTPRESSDSLSFHAEVCNLGSAFWLPSEGNIGAVKLGCHLLSDSGTCIDLDYFRFPLPSSGMEGIPPGSTVAFDLKVPLPDGGPYILEFDLVSEGVAWFSTLGLRTSRFPTANT